MYWLIISGEIENTRSSTAQIRELPVGDNIIQSRGSAWQYQLVQKIQVVRSNGAYVYALRNAELQHSSYTTISTDFFF